MAYFFEVARARLSCSSERLVRNGVQTAVSVQLDGDGKELALITVELHRLYQLAVRVRAVETAPDEDVVLVEAVDLGRAISVVDDCVLTLVG